MCARVTRSRAGELARGEQLLGVGIGVQGDRAELRGVAMAVEARVDVERRFIASG
jgi:hypothetical protein